MATAAETPSKPAGLWQLMGREPAQREPPVEESGSPTPAESIPAPAAPTGRSLWRLMGNSSSEPRRRPPSPSTDELPAGTQTPPAATAGNPPAVPAVPHHDPFSQAFPGADRRLRALAERDAAAGPASPLSPGVPPAAAPELKPAEAPLDLRDDEPAPPPELEPAGDIGDSAPADVDAARVVIQPVAPAVTIPGASPAPGLAPTKSRRAWQSLLLGALAVPLGFLAIIPSVWTQLPATLFGLSALYLGFVAIQEMKRSRGRQGGRPIALAGIGLGILAMFLGPLVLSPLDLWNRAARAYTDGHLRSIGASLEEYHRKQGHYPPGSTFAEEPAANPAPLHSWLTLLLPQLGQQELYGKIDLDRPFNDAANAPVFRQQVPEFLASGSSREPVQGLAPAHFAGVGGEVSLAEGGYAHAGLFGETEGITRDDISDGLSQTLVAGEISHELPPWGAPRNWRLIGKGLNRELRGFGGADGTGAAFLLADGSVRFFARETSRELLEQMSTRDGGEPLPVDVDPAVP